MLVLFPRALLCIIWRTPSCSRCGVSWHSSNTSQIYQRRAARLLAEESQRVTKLAHVLYPEPCTIDTSMPIVLTYSVIGGLIRAALMTLFRNISPINPKLVSRLFGYSALVFRMKTMHQRMYWTCHHRGWPTQPQRVFCPKHWPLRRSVDDAYCDTFSHGWLGLCHAGLLLQDKLCRYPLPIVSLSWEQTPVGSCTTRIPFCRFASRTQHLLLSSWHRPMVTLQHGRLPMAANMINTHWYVLTGCDEPCCIIWLRFSCNLIRLCLTNGIPITISKASTHQHPSLHVLDKVFLDGTPRRTTHARNGHR